MPVAGVESIYEEIMMMNRSCVSAWARVLLRRSALVFAALACLVLAGMPSAGQAQALQRINVGMQPIVNGPVYIAIKEGYFKQLGLDVNLVKFTSGPAQFAALAGGQIDLAWGGMGAFLIAKANGQDLNFISIFMDYNPLEALVVPASSPVKSIKDLAGKKVGLVTGSDANYGMVKAMEANGMVKGSVDLLGMAPPQQIAALQSGDVDAVYLWEPFLTPLYEKGARPLLKLSDLNPGSAYLGWAGKRAWLDANSDVIIKLLKGWDMGLKKMHEDPELAIRYTLDFAGMNPAQARAIVKGLGNFESTAALDPKSPVYWAKGSPLNKVIHDFLAFGRAQGLVKGNAGLDVDGYVMTRFMKAVADAR